MKRPMTSLLARAASTLAKEAGDISSVFPSLSGKPVDPLPPRYSNVKRQRIAGNEDAVSRSWQRLLASLRQEIDKVKREGSQVWAITEMVPNQPNPED